MSDVIQAFSAYITDYGYLALYLFFFLGIIGVPLPEETLLVLSGFLVSTNQLAYGPTVAVCFLGSISAMTTAYWIGRKLGYPFVMKYGRRFGLSQSLYKRTERWFCRVGKWALPLGYFIPGVRQFTAYFAGIIKLPFPVFSLYTYTGGLFWSVLFVTLGWQLGSRWEQLFEIISRNMAVFSVIVLAVIAAIYLLQRRRRVE